MPAMQMFVAPLYDPQYGSYVNATSLIMIGDDGECLIEKGAERARLRVRLVRPPPPKVDPPPPPPPPGAPIPEQAPIFCQLDVQRKLGQYKGMIALAHPNSVDADPVKFEYPFRKSKDAKPLVPAPPTPKPPPGSVVLATPDPDPPPYDPFRGTPFSKGRTGVAGKRETGSSVYPRYSALEQILVRGGDPKDPVKELGEIADDVYSGLLADRKMRFIGCLRYPYFSSEQLDIIFLKNDSLPEMKAGILDDTTDLFKNNTPTAEFPEFWKTEITKFPWPPAPLAQGAEPFKAKRFDAYFSDVTDYKLTQSYQKSIVETVGKENATAEKKIKAQFTNDTPANQKTFKDEYAKDLSDSVKSRVLLSLWPYKQAYVMLRKQVKAVCENAFKMWTDLYNKVTDTGKQMSTVGTIPTTDKTKPDEKIKFNEMTPFELARVRKLVLEKLSFTIYDRRFQPYNPKLVKEHEELEQLYVEVDKALRIASVAYGPIISKIETMHSRCKMYKDLFIKSYQELEGAVRHAERSQGPAPVMYSGDPLEKSFVDTNIDITDARKGDEFKDYYQPGEEDYEAAKACRELPAPKATCKDIKPTSIRAGQLLKNRKGKGKDFETDDEWRDKIFNLMEKIFVKVCPYMNEEFPTAINRLVKGYLMGEPAGTGLERPVNGSMLEIYNHNYQGIIYNETYQRINPSNFTKPKSTHDDWKPKPKLNIKQEFWDYIIQALEHCEEHAAAMQFWHNEEGDKPAYVTFRKLFQNNNTEAHYDVEDLIMQEKADQEFAFNWAIDMNWRIFATVLGVCMPKYEFKIPLISARFYALYSQDFLSPLRQIWMSNRDNAILKLIMGNFYGACKGDKWAKICMESAFVESGDRSYRPPRYLYVNAFTEMNYFTTGPMAGTSGILSSVGNR